MSRLQKGRRAAPPLGFTTVGDALEAAKEKRLAQAAGQKLEPLKLEVQAAPARPPDPPSAAELVAQERMAQRQAEPPKPE
jgi:hypothetical protein